MFLRAEIAGLYRARLVQSFTRPDPHRPAPPPDNGQSRPCIRAVQSWLAMCFFSCIAAQRYAAQCSPPLIRQGSAMSFLGGLWKYILLEGPCAEGAFRVWRTSMQCYLRCYSGEVWVCMGPRSPTTAAMGQQLSRWSGESTTVATLFLSPIIIMLDVVGRVLIGRLNIESA